MMLSDEVINEIWNRCGNRDDFARAIWDAAIAKEYRQAQGDRELELEFTRIMSRISSVNFEFVNGEPEPAPRSGRSVPIILGVAWKVFKAAKEQVVPEPPTV